MLVRMIDRRSVLALGAAALALPPARAACAQTADWTVVPPRAGALDWRLPIAHASQGGWAAPVTLSREILALNRTNVEVDGFFLPYLPEASPVFLLTPYLTHCEGCVPNKPFSVVGIAAKTPREDGAGVLTYRGTFVIAPENPSGYPFWLLDAETVST
jgi:hypothetical protein